MKNMKVGIQLYTIREPLAQDFKGVLRDLVKLGCDGVEFAFNYGNMEPDELAAYMKEIGLHTCGMHIGAQSFDDPNNKNYAYAKALGCKYLTFSFGGPFSKNLPEVVRLAKIAGEGAAKNGLTFTYHNHAAEFEKIDGVYAIDKIFEATDPKKVQSELDVYWVKKGGEDPVKYIRKYAKRLPQIHMKDMDPDDGGFTELGRGTVDLKACVDAAVGTACKWLIYEEDTCHFDQFESAKISLEYLRKIVK